MSVDLGIQKAPVQKESIMNRYVHDMEKNRLVGLSSKEQIEALVTS